MSAGYQLILCKTKVNWKVFEGGFIWTLGNLLLLLCSAVVDGTSHGNLTEVVTLTGNWRSTISIEDTLGTILSTVALLIIWYSSALDLYLADGLAGMLASIYVLLRAKTGISIDLYNLDRTIPKIKYSCLFPSIIDLFC